MREILFRGKRLDNGEWVEGDLVHSVYKVEDTCVGTYAGSLGMHQVDNFTVGQYTGLKDKNGKLIFEGDIVRCGTGRTCKVIFFTSPCFSGFDLIPIDGFDAPPPRKLSLFSDTEVIGNIHDKPAFLEVSP